MERPLQARNAQHIIIDGEPLVMFCSNDYLGLSHDRRVIAAAVNAAEKYGCGTGGAPGTSGTTELHRELAETIAAFKNRRRAVLFPSGYAANVAVHAAIAGDDTAYFYEERHHPSAVEGIVLSGCPRHKFGHLDFAHLEKLLAESNNSRKIVTIPSVFTLDGAITPLDELIRLKEKYGFLLIIDEAHATGALGDSGRGLEEYFNLKGAADIIMGTFSKALGSQGGFLAFDPPPEKLFGKPLREYVYSTSLSAMAVGAALKSLQILQAEPELISRMKTNAGIIHQTLSGGGIRLNQPGRYILNAYFGNDEEAESVREQLRRSGYFVIKIQNAERHGLRITAMATHTAAEITGFCRSLISICHRKQ